MLTALLEGSQHCLKSTAKHNVQWTTTSSEKRLAENLPCYMSLDMQLQVAPGQQGVI